jgi:DNA-binding transcriptional ArsR family regulator
MANRSFLMVSLEEDKAKKLAQVISNDRCRKILDYLSSHDNATETEIAEELSIPLSTVHYNIQQLLKSGLLKSDRYHYSRKGKEVQHYSLANKYIIISPKPVYGIKQKLKSILPAMLAIAGIAGIIKMLEPAISPAINTAPTRKAMAEWFAAEPVTGEAITDTAAQHTALTYNDIIIWFIAGALLALALYIMIDFMRQRYKR